MIARIESWMFDSALPLWAERGLDRRHGGPVEALKLSDATPVDAGFKRARVCARQLYVFSHAHLLGWSGGRDVAEQLFAFMVDRFWQGPDRGWRRRVTTEGRPLDNTPDLYDHAFTLFALGWWYKASRDYTALVLAGQTLDFIDENFRHPLGGFHNEIPATLPRQQNPHMHLIEAALTLFEASSDNRYRDLADEIAGLFEARFLKLPEGVVPEWFKDDLKPIDGDKGRWIEPGHLCEWAWILGLQQKLTGRDNAALIAGMVRWVAAHGMNARSGLVLNGVRDDGVVIDRGGRTWTTTECIKGWIAASEVCGITGRASVEGCVEALFRTHLEAPVRGCWVELFDPDGRPMMDTVPASTLYHIFLSFSEVLRMWPSKNGPALLPA